MFAKLDRPKFIEELNKLGDEKDEVVLAAARDLHAKLLVANYSWDDLLVSDQSHEEEDVPDDDHETVDLLSEEEIKEVLSLIKKIESIGVSEDTKKELEEYKLDVTEGDITQLDLRYLRSLNDRLSK
ncbi:MAG: hypothetical protein VX617_00545 [Pseudomonadota bacterium]|nr:hypothetical protein [Pseudomonadota bacterium]